MSGGTPVSRRAVLRGLGLAGLAAAAGCGTGDRDATVRVAVVWSGAELRAFRAAVRDFTGNYPYRVSVVSLGDYAEPLLQGGLAPAVAPDVAILPQPTLLGDGSRLVDLREVVSPLPTVAAPWSDLALDTGKVPRGIWYKATHKSLVWYRKDVFSDHGVREEDIPTDWVGWLALCDELIGRGVAPLALGAADGWVVTDWFENALLGQDPSLLDPARAETGWTAPADRAKVRAALTDLAGLWSREKVFFGGTERALLLQFGDSVLDVMARGRAAMVAGADFTYSVAHPVVPDDDRLGWFRFPQPGRADDPPVLVGGDLAVLLESPGDGGTAFIQWLAQQRAATSWAADGGFVSLDPRVGGYPEVYGSIPAEVQAATGLRYDLSDRLSTGRLAGGDGSRGLSWILQQFLRDLGAGPSGAPAAVATAMRRLKEAGEPR